MPETLLFSGAPVLEVDGAVRSDLRRDLLALVVDHSTAGLATFEATFLAAGPAGDTPGQLQLLDVGPIGLGAEIKLSLGAGDGRLVFDGVVSAVEARFDRSQPPRVVVFAEDRLFALHLACHRRTWDHVDDEDVVRTVVAEHGLSCEVAVGGPTATCVQQWNETDLAFLRRRADLLGAELWVEGTTVHLAVRENRPGEEVVLVTGGNLLSLDVRADLAHQRSAALVSGYDVHDRDTIQERAGVEQLAGEPGAGRLGPDLLSDALGQVDVLLDDLVPTHGAEAQAWAVAELRRRGRRLVTATAVASGCPELAVGSRVTLVDAGAPFDGAGYYATHVRHTFDLAEGLQTEAQLERARVGS